MYIEKDNYWFKIKNGWCFVGTVVEIDDKFITLNNSRYYRSAGGTHINLIENGPNENTQWEYIPYIVIPKQSIENFQKWKHEIPNKNNYKKSIHNKCFIALDGMYNFVGELKNIKENIFIVNNASNCKVVNKTIAKFINDGSDKCTEWNYCKNIIFSIDSILFFTEWNHEINTIDNNYNPPKDHSKFWQHFWEHSPEDPNYDNLGEAMLM